jgi:hypothetical protein
MGKYAVAYISFFDDDLELSMIEAESESEAAKKRLEIEGFEEFPDSIEDIEQWCFDCDTSIKVLRIE